MDPRCKLWTVLFFIEVFTLTYGFSPPDVHVKPAVRYLTVWEGESQDIDCYITYTERTDDLRWTKRYPDKGSYTGERRTDDNGDRWFTSHSLLRFKSIKSSDAGIYTCTFNPRPGFGSQCEIKLIVQEECDAGKYGIGCTSNCSKFCKEINTLGKESPCNYKDGHCLHGCLPGYLGANCSSVCDRGKYGPECSLLCSEFCKGNGSLDESRCHPETGICEDGCQDGYTGKFCTTYIAENNYVSVILVAIGVTLVVILVLILVLLCMTRNRKQLYHSIKGIFLKPQPSAHSVNEERSSHLGSSNDDDAPPLSQTLSSDSA